MIIEREIDVEYEVQQMLAPYFTVYCRPLPAEYALPNLLITQVGGQAANRIDGIDIVIDARANTEAEAQEYRRNAVGVLKKLCEEQQSAVRRMQVNTSGSWGVDPVRPDIAMCSTRLRVWAHPEITEVNKNGNE